MDHPLDPSDLRNRVPTGCRLLAASSNQLRGDQMPWRLHLLSRSLVVPSKSWETRAGSPQAVPGSSARSGSFKEVPTTGSVPSRLSTPWEDQPLVAAARVAEKRRATNPQNELVLLDKKVMAACLKTALMELADENMAAVTQTVSAIPSQRPTKTKPETARVTLSKDTSTAVPDVVMTLAGVSPVVLSEGTSNPLPEQSTPTTKAAQEPLPAPLSGASQDGMATASREENHASALRPALTGVSANPLGRGI